jgi:hypothetical protein
MKTEIQLEEDAKYKLREVLARVPFISVGVTEVPPLFGLLGPRSPDFLLLVQAGNDAWRLACEVKAMAQPRQARSAVLEMKDYLKALGDPKVYPVLLAPFISPDSAEICRQAGVGCADFAGNCYLVFGTVFIEQSGASNPKAQKRGLRSLFSPKAARILRCLLREPHRIWRVKELEEKAEVSLGQVSNVRQALLEREWAEARSDGLVMRRADALLDAWRGAYEKRRPLRNRYYTLLRGDALEQAIRAALNAAGQGECALLASFSAAHWQAPFARYPSQVFYADETGESILQQWLQLEPVSKGENVIIERPTDEGILADRDEPAPGIWCTGLVQTYLDLCSSGERGVEAAEHLRQTRIAPLWQGVT